MNRATFPPRVRVAALAKDEESTACARVLPSRDLGAAGAVIRPAAIGTPGRR